MTPRAAPPDPLVSQMHDLHAIAVGARMWEVAGWIERHFPWAEGKGHCCPPKLATRGERVQTILADTWDENGQLR